MFCLNKDLEMLRNNKGNQKLRLKFFSLLISSVVFFESQIFFLIAETDLTANFLNMMMDYGLDYSKNQTMFHPDERFDLPRANFRSVHPFCKYNHIRTFN